MRLNNKVQLIAYPNRIGRDLRDLADFVETRLGDAIGGVHILPPFPSNADGGFSPLTHKEIAPEFGDWTDIGRIAARYDVCLDLVLNHIADDSIEFRDFVANGKESQFASLFVDVDALGEIGPVIDAAAQFISPVVEGEQLLIACCETDFVEGRGVRPGRFRCLAACLVGEFQHFL
jgi:hypothetical protein